MEYARDVESPSTTTTTTQETVALYLKNQNLPAASRLCVVNAGLNDMSIPGITTDLYVKNVKDYLNGLAPHCQAVVWLSISATTIPPNTPAKPQTNSKIEEWNGAVKQMLTDDGVLSNKVIYLDVYEASLKAPTVDEIHKQDSYYGPLTKLFTSPIEKAMKG